MKDTKRYLNTATRGLWGRERRELRTELEGHIKLRVNELMLQGMNEAAAEQQVLHELGAPTRVSSGMLQVHTLPVVMKGGLAAMILATAVLSVFQHGQAQVQSIYSTISSDFSAAGYLDFQPLKTELQRLGITVSGPDTSPAFSVPGTIRPTNPVYPFFTSPPGTIQISGKTYLATQTLISSLLATGATLQLTGWKNPRLVIQGRSLDITTSDWRVLNDLYFATLLSSKEAGMLNTADRATTVKLPLMRLEPNGNTDEVKLFTPQVQPGHVYALITAQFNDWSIKDTKGKEINRGNIMLISNINQAAKGQVAFRIYNDVRPMRLYSDMASFQKAFSPYLSKTKGGHWDAQHPAPALLLELSGKFGQDAFKAVAAKSVSMQLAGLDARVAVPLVLPVPK